MEIRQVRVGDCIQGPIIHESLLDELLERIRNLWPTVGWCISPTLEQWEVGFMRDMKPEREVECFEAIAKTVTKLKSRYDLTEHRQKHVVEFLIGMSLGVNARPKSVKAQLGKLDPNEVHDLWKSNGGYIKPPIVMPLGDE